MFIYKLEQMERDKEKQKSLEELQKYMKKFKEFQFDKAKDMLSHHLSIGADVIKKSKSIQYMDAQELESRIILGIDREQVT